MRSIPKPGNGANYTSVEIVQILERAKELGVKFLKVDGFEATWGIEQAAPPLAHQKGWEERPQAEGPRRAGNLCNVCGEEKIMGKFGKPYCVKCFIAKKERNEK